MLPTSCTKQNAPAAKPRHLCALTVPHRSHTVQWQLLRTLNALGLVHSPACHLSRPEHRHHFHSMLLSPALPQWWL
ncbi:hypothetical protein [Flavonifractor phage Chenonceau]|nr:hypothetical protein [Flavonifractor phage Chenonceau]